MAMHDRGCSVSAAGTHSLQFLKRRADGDSSFAHPEPISYGSLPRTLSSLEPYLGNFVFPYMRVRTQAFRLRRQKKNSTINGIMVLCFELALLAFLRLYSIARLQRTRANLELMGCFRIDELS